MFTRYVLLGCPTMPWRYFERPHAVGAWVCTPVEKPQAPPPPGPGLVEEQPQDDGRVAMTDPLIGLLDMQVLSHCVHHVVGCISAPTRHEASCPCDLVTCLLADLPRRIVPCPALPCLALPCLALPCLALPCLVLPCLMQ